MTTIFIEIGVFCVALIATMYFHLQTENKTSQDCKLFSRLLLAAIAIFVIDTLGWVIDGKPLFGQIWITTVVDGLDLIFTTVVCWCWVQYALYIARGEKQQTKKWYQNPSTWLLIFQIALVFCSQIFGFYYSVDVSGVYHREAGYIFHTLISLAMLSYSSVSCLIAAHKESDAERKKDNRFVAVIIAAPVVGNIIQLLVYGYPTVWLCMGLMIFAVYVHIQNKRANAEREANNKELQKALEEAKRADKAKTEFFSRMSHDMRTPMNGILGMIRLSKDSDDVTEIHSNLTKAESAGAYMLSLINDTLDLQRMESKKMKLEYSVVPTEEYYNNIFSILKVSAEQRQLDFRVKYIDIDLDNYLEIDATRLKQVLSNLISNAIKFTPAGGVVEVTVESLGQDNNILHRKYTVTDTGVGMSEEFIKNQLFKPYSQENNELSSQLTGSGLGMAISKNLIELMGGHLEVESAIGEGTTYAVYLDIKRASKESIEKLIAERAERNLTVLANLAEKKILLFEDHPLNAEIAQRLLKKVGCEVEWAENGQVGLECFKNSPEGSYDAILMDLRMPVMDGLTAAKELRRLNRQDAKTIPILAMTANAYESDIKDCLDAGMNAHIAKPIEPQALYATLYDYICGSKATAEPQ